MAVVAALATAETGHYEDENEHPQARRAETAQRLWKGNRVLTPPERQKTNLAGRPDFSAASRSGP